MRHQGSGDGFLRCSDGHVRWGLFGAAGVVFVRLGDDGAPLVMIQLRSGWSHEGGTWSCPGGALEYGEAPFMGALREASEEVGLPELEPVLLGQYEFTPATDWTYTTVVVLVDGHFGLTMNFESDAVDWVAVDDVERRALHPGFAAAWPHVRPIVESAGAPT